MNKKLKNVLVGLGVMLVLLQFVPLTLNQGTVEGIEDITKAVEVPKEVNQILQKSCYDCHSNSTVYPWYTHIQPVGMWMQHHVDEGKRELNFSAFNLYSTKRKAHKMEEIVEMVENGEMPLKSYTLIHGNAVLSESEKATLMAWAKKSFAAIKIAP